MDEYLCIPEDLFFFEFWKNNLHKRLKQGSTLREVMNAKEKDAEERK